MSIKRKFLSKPDMPAEMCTNVSDVLVCGARAPVYRIVHTHTQRTVNLCLNRTCTYLITYIGKGILSNGSHTLVRSLPRHDCRKHAQHQGFSDLIYASPSRCPLSQTTKDILCLVSVANIRLFEQHLSTCVRLYSHIERHNLVDVLLLKMTALPNTERCTWASHFHSVKS